MPSFAVASFVAADDAVEDESAVASRALVVASIEMPADGADAVAAYPSSFA